MEEQAQHKKRLIRSIGMLGGAHQEIYQIIDRNEASAVARYTCKRQWERPVHSIHEGTELRPNDGPINQGRAHDDQFH